MKAERRRLDRLKRLERIRAVAKQQIAAESAQAEETLAQLNQLIERTQSLVSDYAKQGDVIDGYELTQATKFAAGLCHVVSSTQEEAVQAQAIADGKMSELAAAERSRAAVEKRVDKTRRDIAGKGQNEPAGATRKSWQGETGTELE